MEGRVTACFKQDLSQIRFCWPFLGVFMNRKSFMKQNACYFQGALLKEMVWYLKLSFRKDFGNSIHVSIPCLLYQHTTHLKICQIGFSACP